MPRLIADVTFAQKDYVIEVAKEFNCSPSEIVQSAIEAMMDGHAEPDEGEVTRLRRALEFYADPFKRDVPVPDFYRELSFGDVAHEALKPLT